MNSLRRITRFAAGLLATIPLTGMIAGAEAVAKPATQATTATTTSATPPPAAASVYVPPEDPAEVMRVSPEMRAYFERFINAHDDTLAQAHDLIDAVLDADKFAFTYQWNGVYDVGEVFRRHRGNCISFTLFVAALFEEFGLDPTINEVSLYRTHWTSLGRYVAEVGHVNVTIVDHGRLYCIDFARIFGQDLSIDASTPLSRREALALFYCNHGVHAYTSGQPGALRWLEKALAINANYSTHSNLATAYIHEGRLELARLHIEKAARHHKNERLFALLAGVETRLGNNAAAEAALAKARKYMESNPYYHYSRALQAEDKGDHVAAAKALERALRLKEAPLFLRLQVAVQRSLGRDTAKLERRLERLESDWAAAATR